MTFCKKTSFGFLESSANEEVKYVLHKSSDSETTIDFKHHVCNTLKIIYFFTEISQPKELY